jgi:hypothetical protein
MQLAVSFSSGYEHYGANDGWMQQGICPASPVERISLFGKLLLILAPLGVKSL